MMYLLFAATSVLTSYVSHTSESTANRVTILPDLQEYRSSEGTSAGFLERYELFSVSCSLHILKIIISACVEIEDTHTWV